MTVTPQSTIMDPDAVLDWRWDWTDWLADNETIAGHTFTADNITIDSDESDGTTVTAWLSQGQLGKRATITCHIVTSQGREDDRTLRLTIANR